MAGHSQFKNIMVRKGKQDAKRGKVFTKIIREIISAAKSGMPDPAANPRLRSAIQWAREENMPRDKIDAAIKRGSGNSDADNFETIRYEGYGAGGVAVIVQALTDNRNRTAPDIRSTFTKCSGTMGEPGSVAFMFDYVGLIYYPAEAATDEAMLEAAIEAGADNCESDAHGHSITTSVENFLNAREALDKAFGAAMSAKLSWQPKMTSTPNEEQARQVLKLIDMLEDNDDVQDVFTNADISPELMEKLSA
ncbi:MAG: YebC/PmpR family DNA-binding transcriptional regulator [Alphaproteobacteria bacterium]|nr:YebC/PmpR family DNA-binding transcriptional regulator [Alphaproteobacteria bacterium]